MLRGEELRKPRRRSKNGEESPLCIFNGCVNKQNYASGLCDAHGWQLKHGNELSPLRKREKKNDIVYECRIKNCSRKYMAKELCGKHYNIERTYGITAEQFESMVSESNGLCEICGGEPHGIGNTLHVDHDHITNKVRGVLCSNCNTSLGGFQESIETLLKAVNYLKKHSK